MYNFFKLCLKVFNIFKAILQAFFFFNLVKFVLKHNTKKKQYNDVMYKTWLIFNWYVVDYILLIKYKLSYKIEYNIIIF